MGKTDAERQRQRRQRLKENPRLYERYKNDDRVRKQNTRVNMSPGELNKLAKGLAKQYRNIAALSKMKTKITQPTINMETEHLCAKLSRGF